METVDTTPKQRITYSQITTERKCSQSYNYAYIEYLEPYSETEPPVELYFGTWWHAIRAAHAVERGVGEGTLKSAPDRIEGTEGRGIDLQPVAELLENPTLVEGLRVRVLEQVQEWQDSLTPEALESFEARLGAKPAERLYRMDADWRERWLSELENESVLAVEHKWERELPGMYNPHTRKPEPSNTVLYGYIDEVYFDKRRKRVVVRDHKTSKALEASTSLSDMQESQLQLYAWGVAPDTKAWGYPSPGAVAYDRVRSSAPKQPKLTKAGKLSAAVKDFDLNTYREFVSSEPEFEGTKKDGSGAGVYMAEDDVIERLSQRSERDKWQARTFSPLNINIVKMHLAAAVSTAWDIQTTKDLVAVKGEAPRNMTKMNCKFCSYSELCRSQMFGGVDGEYDLQALNLRRKPKSNDK